MARIAHIERWWMTRTSWVPSRSRTQPKSVAQGCVPWSASRANPVTVSTKSSTNSKRYAAAASWLWPRTLGISLRRNA